MRDTNLRIFVLPAVAVLFMLSLLACSSGPRFNYNTPPTASSRYATPAVSQPGRTVVAVATFVSPERASVRMNGIGAGMSEALGRTLRRQNKYDVRTGGIDAAELDRIVYASTAERRRQLDALRATFPGVDYAVLGKVTDFHHTSDVSDDVKRWGIFSRRDEAIVAIKYAIVDLRDGRIVREDHIRGTASAGKDEPGDLYANLTFGSYLFWSTPLGSAGTRAIDRAAEDVSRAVPAMRGELMIVRRLTMREVEVSGGANHGLLSGAEYFVCVPDATTGALQTTEDVHTGQPVRARVLDVDAERSSAWLVGQPSVRVNLRGAKLLADAPAKPATTNPSGALGGEMTATVSENGSPIASPR